MAAVLTSEFFILVRLDLGLVINRGKNRDILCRQDVVRIWEVIAITAKLQVRGSTWIRDLQIR